MRNIRESVANFTKLQSFEETFSRSIDQVLRFFADLSYSVGSGGIADVTFVGGPYIDADDIALLNDSVSGRNTMYNFFIDRHTGTGRKSAIPFKGRYHSVIPYCGFHKSVNVLRRYPGLDESLQFFQNGSSHLARYPH